MSNLATSDLSQIDLSPLRAHQGHHTAITCQQQQLTYAELVSKSNRLAEILRHTGTELHAPVAIALHSCTELVVAVVALLMAKRTFLFVSPEELQALPFTINCVLTDRPLPEAAATLMQINLHADSWLTSPTHSDQAEPTPTTPNKHPTAIKLSRFVTPDANVVYHQLPESRLIYPLRWAAAHFPLSAGDTVAFVEPADTEINVWQLLWPLLAGATLAVRSPKETLASFLAKQEVTHVVLGSNSVNATMVALRESTPAKLKTLIYCGPSPTTETLNTLNQQAKHIAVAYFIHPATLGELGLACHLRVNDTSNPELAGQPVSGNAFLLPNNSDVIDSAEIATNLRQNLHFAAIPLQANSDEKSLQWLPTEIKASQIQANVYRIQLAATAEIAPETKPNPRKPNDVELKLAEIVSDTLSLDSIDVQDNYLELCPDMEQREVIANKINTIFDLALQAEDLERYPTITQLAEPAKQSRKKLGTMLVQLNKVKDQPSLFFVCGIALYGNLAKNLGNNYSCYGIYVPEEEAFIKADEKLNSYTLEDLARCYVKAIKKHTPNGPYTVAGASFGGVLAFEIARQLQQMGDTISGLVIFDAILPGTIKRTWASIKISVGRRLRRLLSKETLYKVRKQLTSLTKPKKAPKITAEARKKQLTNILKGPRVRDYFYNKPTFGEPTLIVRAGYQGEQKLAPDLNWGSKLTGPMILSEAPGDHLEILQSKETADLIVQFLRPRCQQ
ncbi:non-ribosomal peptide synthetase [Halioxenophilus sp. WMMB6]|uniref:non-ribosomal peptide synthetase n=1 Tax=Halioxenophilus sp. WMMB6 TaxID=3073815 RepID=UPI00295E3C06|nr:thioesterase domain-containing protein [Halioxenophilus sp. WMMB6]